MTQALNVWMNGELVGRWTVDRAAHTFRYETTWLASPHRRSLSLSLPISSSLGIIGGTRVDLSDSVHNEWLCAQIVTALGLQAATTTIGTFAEETVLVVERFDRKWMDDGTWIARLPQCLQLLQGSLDKNDALFFLLTQLVFFLLAAQMGTQKTAPFSCNAEPVTK